MTGLEPVAAAEVLDLLGRDINEPVRVARLTGGYRNLVQRVQGQGFDWVVKQYAATDDNPLFPLRFEDELRLLADYQDTDIAPCLVTTDPSRRLLVYEFVPGEVWNGDLAGAAALLSRVGKAAPRDWLRRLPSEVGELRAHTVEILEMVSDPPLLLLENFDVDDEAFRPALVHTDSGPGNMVGTDGRYRLVDWQCPGLGDPVEDLAAFTSPGVQILYGRSPLQPPAVEKLLMSYQDPEVVKRYRWKARLYSARFAAYCAWRIENLRGQSQVHLYRQALSAELEFLGL